MNNNGTVLVIDDEQAILQVMTGNLKQNGLSVVTADSAMEGLKLINREIFDTIIVDYQMPQMNGLEFLDKLKELEIEIPVIMVTAYGTIEMAVEAMKKGAVNYLTKPINYEEMELIVKNAIDKQKLLKEVTTLRQEISDRYGLQNFIGKNEEIMEILDKVLNIAETDATVLIQGETGTGKELIARAIQLNSLRKHKPFVKLNCATIPDNLLESELFGHEKGAFTNAHKQHIGKFELANTGTIYLDEVGDISLAVQSKLLRVLQEGEFDRVGGNRTLHVNARVVATTNRNLEEAVKNKEFRSDLYYRLNVIPIYLPPLRERKDDIPLLVRHFVKLYSIKNRKKIKAVSKSAMNILVNYPWPGNIRELENALERAVILEKEDDITDKYFHEKHDINIDETINLDGDLNFKKMKNRIIEGFEKEYISKLLKKYNGNISKASVKAQLNYKNFFEKMKRYEIKKQHFE
tara:strand:+ start:18246 stop:19634 length:1389 start_codon:yes stop_codon:yes gene_type:complete